MMVRTDNKRGLKYLAETHNKDIDPNLQDDDGFTALHYAVKNNMLECVKILRKYFGKRLILDMRDNKHYMPSDYAEFEEIEHAIKEDTEFNSYSLNSSSNKLLV